MHPRNAEADGEKAPATLEKSLQKCNFNSPVCSGHLETSPCRAGECALQKMLHLILENAKQTRPEPVAVIVFLHSDHTGMPEKEVDELVDGVLETSRHRFRLKNASLPEWPTHWNNTNERGSILHHLSEEIGGQYFRAPEDLYATVLEDILLQLLFRYERDLSHPLEHACHI